MQIWRLIMLRRNRLLEKHRRQAEHLMECELRSQQRAALWEQERIQREQAEREAGERVAAVLSKLEGIVTRQEWLSFHCNQCHHCSGRLPERECTFNKLEWTLRKSFHSLDDQLPWYLAHYSCICHDRILGAILKYVDGSDISANGSLPPPAPRVLQYPLLRFETWHCGRCGLSEEALEFEP